MSITLFTIYLLNLFFFAPLCLLGYLLKLLSGGAADGTLVRKNAVGYIAADNAKFGVLNRRFNVPLVDGLTVRLPRIIGLGRAMDMIITGRVVDAQEALQFGLVSEIVPRDKLMERATQIAEQICEYPQGSIRTDKESVLRSYGHSLSEAYLIEAELGALTQIRGVTSQTGATAFAEGKIGRHGQRTTGKKWGKHGL